MSLTALVLEALVQAICGRMPGREVALIHHSDRGVQISVVALFQTPKDAQITISVGRVGDSY